MIQRIQTVHLLLALIAGVLCFVIPFSIESFTEAGIAEVKFNKIVAHKDFPVLFFVADLIICSVMALFNYKNHKTQKLFCLIGLFISLVCAGLMYYRGNNPAEGRILSFGIILPLVSLLLFLMAYRSIRKDEKLIKSLDRLR